MKVAIYINLTSSFGSCRSANRKGGMQEAGFEIFALLTFSHTRWLQTSRSCWTNATEEMAPDVWDLPTFLQLQSKACCSPGRWSSSTPTADGPTTPESAYLADKGRQWAVSNHEAGRLRNVVMGHAPPSSLSTECHRPLFNAEKEIWQNLWFKYLKSIHIIF